jgi:purine catabolism regulator
MLTVSEALQLPVFATSTLVAGREGIEKEIHWVHIVDIPLATFQWQRRGVLLLTAGYGLRDTAEQQASLVPRLVAEGFAGMVLSVGYYFDAVPEVIRQSADALGFPVIEVPRDVLFIEITEAILERIVNRQYALLQQSSRIFSQLTELVLRGADLNELANTLATLIGRSVTIEDTAFRVIANAQVGPIDAARAESVANGRSSPHLAQSLLDSGVYAQMVEKMGPVYFPPIPEEGMVLERVVAPIIVDREIHGYIWVIIGEKPVAPLDERAISHGATVAALILFKEQAVRRAEEALRDDLLERLLQGPGNSTAFSEQARRLQFHVDRPHQVLMLHSHMESKGSYRSIQPAVESWLRKSELQALVVWHNKLLILVLEMGRADEGQEVAQRLVHDLNHPASRLLVGVGRPCPPAALKSGGLKQSYAEAAEAVQIALAMGKGHGVVSFEALGLLHWLYHTPPAERAGNIYLDHIRNLADYDAERHTELLKTLEMYLEHGGSLVDAAQVLYIHRNTLLHRLERIRELCQVNLRNAWDCLNLYAALKAYQLHGKG